MKINNKALFLDRDGVINIEKNYLYKIEDFIFVKGILDLCRFFENMGYLIIVITNQAGIARKFYNENDFEILTSWMIKTFKDKGINITKVYHCSHHEDITGPCSCRKPNPGMINEAIKDFNINVDKSLLIGDNERDITAAYAAKVKLTYLLSQNIKTSKATKIITALDEVVKIFNRSLN